MNRLFCKKSPFIKKTKTSKSELKYRGFLARDVSYVLDHNPKE